MYVLAARYRGDICEHLRVAESIRKFQRITVSGYELEPGV